MKKQPQVARESPFVGWVRIFVGWDSVQTGSGRSPNLLWLRPEVGLCRELQL